MVLTDEILARRARYGGRNVTGLAILATLFALSIVPALMVAPADGAFFLAASVCTVATACWLLAVAARRGNPLSLGIVIGCFVAQFLLALIAQVSLMVRTDGKVPVEVIWIIIPLLIIVILVRNQRNLIELRRRGLWDAMYAAAPRSTRLCVVGGLLLVVALLTFYGGQIFSAVRAVNNARLRQEFVKLIETEEKEFLDALKAASLTDDADKIRGLSAQADRLQESARAIADKAPSTSSMLSVAPVYVQAIEKWKEGLKTIADGGDETQAERMFSEGDQLRTRALADFSKGAPQGKKQ